MNIKKIFTLALATLFITCNALAQYASLSEREKKVLVERAKEKVAQLNDDISFMADKKFPQKTRNYYKGVAEHLFINDCNPYKEIVEYRDGSQEEVTRSVIMEVASLRNRNARSLTMRRYFENLINMTYKSVKIKSTDKADMRVSQLRPYRRDENGNMLYICSVYFDQVFVGTRGDGGVYKDVTHKWAVCYVNIDKVLDEKTGLTRNEYMVSLGDVHVKSIERLR